MYILRTVSRSQYIIHREARAAGRRPRPKHGDRSDIARRLRPWRALHRAPPLLPPRGRRPATRTHPPPSSPKHSPPPHSRRRRRRRQRAASSPLPPSLAPSRVAGAAAGAQPREGRARYGVRPAAAERLQDDGEPPSDGRPRGACDGQSIWAPVSFLLPPPTSRIGLPVRPGARLEGSHLGICRARAVVCVSPVAWQRASMTPQVFCVPPSAVGCAPVRGGAAQARLGAVTRECSTLRTTLKGTAATTVTRGA